MDERRVFRVTAPTLEGEDMIDQIRYVHDGAHLELFYNLIFEGQGWTLPNHLRPVAWALADRNIKRAMVLISPGAGKSQLMDVAFPIWELGHDPNTTLLSISSGADLMIDFLQAGMTTVEYNKVYQAIFPNVIPDKNQGWSTARGIFIKRDATGQASPSYAATGYGSKLITGKHAKFLIIDDIHDAENSASSEQIEKIETFYYNTIIGRQDPRGSRMIMVGRRWAVDDLYGRLKKSEDWLVMSLASIRDTKELYYDVRIPPGLSCIFNDFKASDKVEDIKVWYGENEENLGFYWNDPEMTSKYEEAMMNKKNKPEIFETVYQSNPELSGKRIFREEDFVDFLLPEEMSFGLSYDTVANWVHKMNFDMLIQSADTALTDNNANDPSCFYTLGLKMCNKIHRAGESIDPEAQSAHYDIYVLDEMYGHMNPGDLETEAVAYFNKWMPMQLLVEKSAAGLPLIHALASYSIPVEGITVQHTSKRGRAINGAKSGSVQGWSRRGRIYIPRNAPWAAGLLGELKDFTGARNGQDDRVDALIQGTNFAIDMGVSSRDLPPGWKTQEEIDKRLLNWSAPNHPLYQLPHQYQNVQNPFYGMCGSCKFYNKNPGKDTPGSYCKYHKRTVTSLSSCQMYDPAAGQEQIISVTYGERKED